MGVRHLWVVAVGLALGLQLAPAAGGQVRATGLGGIPWDGRVESLREAVRLFDPENPFLEGYRPAGGGPKVFEVGGSRIGLADVAYWFYGGRLARVDVLLSGDPDTIEGAIKEAIAGAGAEAGGGGSAAPLAWVQGGIRGVAHRLPEGVHLRLEHLPVAASAEAAARPLTPGAKQAWLVALMEEAAEEIPYRALVQQPLLHQGRAVRYQGRILQVIEEGRWRVGARIGGTIGAGNVLHVRYAGEAAPGLAEGDYIQLLGLVEGLFTYTSLIGTEVVVPGIQAYRVERLQ